MNIHELLASITEGLSSVLYLALFLVSCVLYFGRGGYNLFHHLTCFKLAHRMGPHRQVTIRKRLPLYILINLFCFFLIFRAVGGVLYSLAAVSKSQIPDLYRVIIPIVIIGDYFGFMLYIPIFSALVAVWLQVGVMWSKRTVLLRSVVYTTLFLCNAAVALSFIVMSTLQILRAIFPNHIPGSVPSIGQNFVAAPLMIIVLLVLTALTAVLAVLVVMMLRRSVHFETKHGKDSRRMREQKITMIKCIIAVLTLNAALLIRSGGFILMAARAPLWIPPMLGRYLPEYLSGAVIIIVFWPFRLPSCSCIKTEKGLSFLDPIRFLHDKDDTETGTTVVDCEVTEHEEALEVVDVSNVLAPGDEMRVHISDGSMHDVQI